MRRALWSIGLALSAALAVGSAPAAAPATPSAPPQSCGWVARISGDQLNVAFPDAAARYWITHLTIPPGFHVEFDGRFPHARYISFVTYDPASRSVDGIPDAEIVPDPGSVNPFVAGADRTAPQRSYRVYVRNAVLPARGRAQNTIYTDNGKKLPQTKTSRPTDMTTVIYRVYEPDQGLDITGGVGLPAIRLVSNDGRRRVQIPNCRDHSLPSTQSATNALAAAGSGPGNDKIPSVELGGQDPPVWLKYTNPANGVAAGVLNNPRTERVWPGAQAATNKVPSGGFYDNPDNKYITTFDSAAYGDVLVFHGEAPTTPQTYLPSDTTMGTGQVRYWSMCSNMSTTQYLGCVKDDDAALDPSGYYTIVISTAKNRPASANARCGIEWLPKGPLPSAPIILRNMLAAATFTHAIQDIPAQGQEQATMGPYYPQGYYFDHASNFDAFVNAHGGCGGFTWPYASPPKSYHPPGLPLLG